ncbi:MAG: DEAD/DEAH box helicase [Nocardioidaceae bacterium]
MSFVPVTGPAVLHAAEPPRDSHIEFSDARRTVSLPMRAALPILTRAHARDDLHPSVALLSGAALLAMRLVAAGRFEPDASAVPRWRVTTLDAADEDRIAMLARARAHDDLDVVSAESVIRRMVDAVVDTMPRSAPLAPARRPAVRPVGGTPEETAEQRAADAERRRADFQARLQARIDRHRQTPSDDLPSLVTLSLRVEADEEELIAGSVRLVLQVHDEHNPLHVCDAALLWAEPDAGASHGFGARARTHASIALRGAAEAWPVLERLLELRVPDEITLDTDELVSLLDHGVAALQTRGVDVLWPRSLGRDLTASTVLDRRSAPGAATSLHEEPLHTGLLSAESVFAFHWQIALHGEPLTDAEMDQLATATAPILKLRDNWTVVDPTIARKAKKRLVRTVKPVQALAAALTGVVEIEDAEQEVIVGASLLRMRDRLQNAATRAAIDPSPRLQGRLRDYQRQGLTWLVELTDLGLGACLADDMGLGKTITLIALHLHRHDHDPGAGPTLVVCPASLMGNWEAEIARFAPDEPVRRFHGTRRDLTGLRGGFVLTTYGTVRSDTASGGGQALGCVPWDLVVADEAQHVKNPASATARGLRTIASRARVALTGTPVENNLTELWAILDWATPGLLGSRNAFRKVWAAPIESGLEPTKARQFAGLIGPFLLRRRKSDPGIAPELPAKTETDHPLGLTREQTVLYEAFVRDVMERIERADPEGRRGLVLKLLTGLKQICNHPAHFLKQASGRLAGRSEKIDALDELLTTVVAEDGAALVFTQYVAMGHLLETHLTALGLPHLFLHGGLAVRERESMVRRFQDGEAPVFLLSLKAGGTGLNLTRADHVIHFDRWWNPAVEEQATDRAHRIGQTKPVQVHRLITQGTVEEKVAELLTRKRALADTVLARGEAALTELSNDDLRDLVTLRRRPG